MSLTLERKTEADRTTTYGSGSVSVSLTPMIDEGYWTYRVRLSDSQAVVGFPKFGTIGVGFAVEGDWNTNLPYTCGAEEIRDHILHNKGDDSIADESVLDAIRLVQEAARADEVSR